MWSCYSQEGVENTWMYVNEKSILTSRNWRNRSIMDVPDKMLIIRYDAKRRSTKLYLTNINNTVYLESNYSNN